MVTPLAIQPQRRPFSAAAVMMRGPEKRSSRCLTPRSFVAARAESRASAVRSKVDRRNLALILKEDGDHAFRAGDHATAVALYTEALEEDPSNHAVYSNRSAAHCNLGRFEDALSDANRCIAIDAKFANGHVRKGRALEAIGQWREAVEAYRVGLNFNADNQTLKFAVRRAEEQEGKNTQRSALRHVPSRTPPELEPESEQDVSMIAMMTAENVRKEISDRLIALFERANRNRDGGLTCAELVQSLQSNGELTTQLRLPDNIREKHRELFESVFQAVNNRGGDAISVEEFLSHFNVPIESAMFSAVEAAKAAAEDADTKTLRAIFNQIDTDGSGTLDRDEMDEIALVLGMNFNKAQMDAAWAFMDRDGNGEVDFDEFKNWHDVLTNKVAKQAPVTLANSQGRSGGPQQGKRTSFLKDSAGVSASAARAASDGFTTISPIERMQELGSLRTYDADLRPHKGFSPDHLVLTLCNSL